MIASKNTCSICDGRVEIRRVLYMATVAAIRSNPAIRNYYLQLRARGKHAKRALAACMRKLLVILNAMLRTKTQWQAPALAAPPTTISPLVGAASEHGSRLRDSRLPKPCILSSAIVS